MRRNTTANRRGYLSARSSPIDDFGHREARRVDGRIRLRIERLAALEELPERLARVRMLIDRPPIALPEDAVPVVVRPGLEPDGRRVAAQQGVGLRRRSPARRRRRARPTRPRRAARRASRARAGGSSPRRGARRARRAQVRRAPRRAGRARRTHAQPARQPPADRRLAGAAQAEQRDDGAAAAAGRRASADRRWWFQARRRGRRAGGPRCCRGRPRRP